MRKSAARHFILVISVSVFLSHPASAADKKIDFNENKSLMPGNVVGTATEDYKEFYSTYRLLHLGIAFGAGGIMADTEIDEHMQDWYQSNVRNSTTDKYATIAKNFGEGCYVIPITFAAGALGTYFAYKDEDSAIGTWGERTFRSILVGGPAVVAMQSLTGGDRPNSGNGSSWSPFKSTHGVSGHAFIGAVPFLTLAHMYDDDLFIKYLMYGVSTLAGLSRINDNKHYPSQVFLGWYMAWEATDSISAREKKADKIRIAPIIGNHTLGVQGIIEW